MEELDDQHRTCGICWGDYVSTPMDKAISPSITPATTRLTRLLLTQGEETSFKDGKAEIPVRLPCSHVFGKSCLEVLLKPKIDNGWGERICPLCRREICGISDS